MYQLNLLSTREGVDSYLNIGSSRVGNPFWVAEGGVQGFTAVGEQITTSSPTLPGSTLHGFDYPDITGTITINISPNNSGGMNINEIYRILDDFFDPVYPIIFNVVDTENPEKIRNLPMRLVSPIPAPDRNRSTIGSSFDGEETFEIELEFVSNQGYWTGETIDTSVNESSPRNRGDFDTYSIYSTSGDITGLQIITTYNRDGSIRKEVSFDAGENSGPLEIGTDPQDLFVHEILPGGAKLIRPDLLGVASVLADPVNTVYEKPGDIVSRSTYNMSRQVGSELLGRRYTIRYRSPWGY